MQTKLTLTVDNDVISAAKEYAKRSKRSLSNIVEEYLKSLSDSSSDRPELELIDIVAELKGSVKDPDPKKPYKELLTDALIDKHL